MSRRSDRRRLLRAAELWREQEAWRSATGASELLRVETDISERKWRLFALECCRAVLPLCVEPWHREVFEQAERIVDGPHPGAACRGVTQLGRPEHWRRRWYDWYDWYPDPGYPSRPGHEVWAERALVDLGTWREGTETRHRIYVSVLAALAPEDHAHRAQLAEEWDTRFAGVLREIAGDPFAAVQFDPGWRTSTAICLARMMHTSGDFSLMPILADALQDAGCEDEDLLPHCRDMTLFSGEPPMGSPEPPSCLHIRGCWVVDLVLGKG